MDTIYVGIKVKDRIGIVNFTYEQPFDCDYKAMFEYDKNDEQSVKFKILMELENNNTIDGIDKYVLGGE